MLPDGLLPELAAEVLQLLLEVLALDLEFPRELVALLPPLVDLVHDALEPGLGPEVAAPRLPAQLHRHGHPGLPPRGVAAARLARHLGGIQIY